jgi:DNA-binding LytR/AlgR family response regulator
VVVIWTKTLEIEVKIQYNKSASGCCYHRNNYNNELHRLLFSIICDDESRELSHLQGLVKEYDVNIEVALFLSSENLLDGANKQQFDIVLLDIEMDGLNGFAAAKMLIDMQNPPLIVFVTNSGEYTYRGYEVAFRYLPKPVCLSILSDALTAAYAKIAPYKFTINSNGCSFVVPINEIFYFESFGHRTIVHTKENTYDCRMKLSEAEALLPDNTFAAPHKSYLVNLDFVDTIRENEISISGEIRIPVSRRYKQQFEGALFRFVRRQK